ncbi:mannoprotein [Aspergillus fischeri NRRL 181]|uniref:Cell wall mannoprotein 1 n=1 Tax=Neosartorya fischeri (strain ATCC 1020 / DSM 3700 / CBS 544.65 / FGSC A1164 / JCM 1740 / NRRL 181 / WB 181) TaxID=331117 RepID=A1DIY4_NEOFI|nr:conserved hypothetical protein [Aspergillus fischeri NRRL 181]EAW19341.1 conserved hypothetical protein [Aspergillus fischeri NRRL 181]KAG2003873.1 hypothetical protein GB937_009366 [Aspergillus fischeri]
MHFKLSTAVLATLIGVAISGPLVARDAATILSDLNTIKTGINTLTQHFNEFTGDLSQALAAQAVEQQLESDIDKATSDAKATSALSAADSTSVTNALLGLKPDIVTSLDAIVAKKPQVDSAGVGSLVLADLNALQSKTDTLSGALQDIATATDKETIASGTQEIDAAFSSAIAVFS